MSELDEIKNDIKDLRGEVKDIKDNHLSDIWDALSTIWFNMQELRKDFWRIMGAGAAIIGIVIAIVQR